MGDSIGIMHTKTDLGKEGGTPIKI